jgi:glycosyltransferase involved in cell wall biosynthesis
MNSAKPKLSLVILCFREEDYIPLYVNEVKRNLEKYDIPYKLILVANYFTSALVKKDNSAEIAREIARKDFSVVVVANEKKLGEKMGWDMRSGFEVADGDIVGFTDGDGQVAAGDIAVAYNKIVAENLDAVFGQRVKREDGAMRAVTSKIYNTLFRMFFPRVKVADVN